MRLYDQNIWGNYKADNCIANRNDLIAGLIDKYAPDVCCFQECNPDSSRKGERAIQKLISEHYREACPAVAHRNYTPVFYRPDRVKMIDEGDFLFEGFNDRNSKSATWTVMEERLTGKRFAVLSVHFWWKWESQADEQQRHENARRVAEFCSTLSAKHPIPVLIAGDLNSGINAHQGDATYHEMLRLGMRDVRDLAKESTDSFTAHAYPILNADGIYVDGGQPIKTLDYVFTYGDITVDAKKFAVLTEQNALDSSDHCPLIFDFEII